MSIERPTSVLVFRLEYDGETYDVYAQVSKNRRNFSLFIAAGQVMSNDDLLQAVELMFIELEAKDLDLVGNPAFTADDH